ncbi:MAG: hypothetical protein MUC62_09515 [Candidatus Thermoplasmatota archaeon]|jgi:hypothetical protein|nr:hypothetical protein [Candidatus Thermoplasmatota archaeon]
MISISFKGNILNKLIPIFKRNGFEIKYSKQMSKNHLVLQIHYFKFFTLNSFWKTLFIIANYDMNNNITEVDIVHGLIYKNYWGRELLKGSTKNDEIYVSKYLRSCFL